MSASRLLIVPQESLSLWKASQEDRLGILSSPYSLIPYATTLQEFGLILFVNLLAIFRRAALAEIFSPPAPSRCNFSVSHFRCIADMARWQSRAFRSFILSRVESSILSQKLCAAFPEFRFISISPSQNDPSFGLILTDNSKVHVFYFLIPAPLTMTHLLSWKGNFREIVSTEKIYAESNFFSFPILVHAKIPLRFIIKKVLYALFKNF